MNTDPIELPGRARWRCARFAIASIIALVSLEATAQSELRLTDFRSLGPGGGGATFSAAYHPSNPDIILVGQDVGGVMRSADGGTTWRHVNQGGISGPARGPNVYGVPAIVFHPGAPDIVFCATWAGVFRSSDAGVTWSEVLVTPNLSGSVAISSSNPNLVIVGTSDPHYRNEPGNGIYRSTDGGLTFHQPPSVGMPGNARVPSVAFAPDGSLWAATSAGLLRSTDAGDSFTGVPGPFRHAQGHFVGIASGPGTGTRYWYGLETIGSSFSSPNGGVYTSDDGVSWSEIGGVPVDEGECGELLRAMIPVIDPGDPTRLYMGLRSDGGCGSAYRYDGGWNNLLSGMANTTHTGEFWLFAPEGLAVSTADPRRIAVCTEVSVLLSRDGGETFRVVSVRDAGGGRWSGTGAEVTFVYDITARTGRIYAGFEDIGSWRSDDDGASWSQVTWQPNENVDGASELTVHPSDPDRVYVAVSSWSGSLREPDVISEIAKTSDGGKTVDIVSPSLTGGSVRGRAAVAVAFGATAESDTVYAAFHGDSIFRSRDGGKTWTDIGSGIPGDDSSKVFRIAIDPADDRRLWIGLSSGDDEFPTSGGIHQSTDGGDTWKRLIGFPYRDVTVLAFEGVPARLWASGWTIRDDDGVAVGGLMVSDDGLTFSQVLSQPFVMAITTQPGTATLFAAASTRFTDGEGVNAGIYRSSDGGQTWKRIDSLLPHHTVFALRFTPENPNRLLMGTAGDGIVSARLTTQVERRRPVRRP